MTQANPETVSSEGFEGLALQDFLPLTWEPSTHGDITELELCNQATTRALQALALFEEAPREVSTDPNHPNPELLHLEAKVDVLLSLVTRLINDRPATVQRHATVLRADSVEWAGPASDQARTGDTGILTLYPNPTMPLPFRLPARVVGSVERSGVRWRLTRFEHLQASVAIGLEKLVFRRHRRQVALARGTEIFTKTGILRASKF